MHNHALPHLSRRLLAALFLTSTATAAWAGCCDGGDPGRMAAGRSMACVCAAPDASRRDAPVDTHYGTGRLDGEPASARFNVVDRAEPGAGAGAGNKP
jgi:hypothetical protein